MMSTLVLNGNRETVSVSTNVNVKGTKQKTCVSKEMINRFCQVFFFIFQQTKSGVKEELAETTPPLLNQGETMGISRHAPETSQL